MNAVVDVVSLFTAPATNNNSQYDFPFLIQLFGFPYGYDNHDRQEKNP